MFDLASIILAALLQFTAVDHGAISIFVESRRSEENGPGKILFVGRADFNDDSIGDTIAFYTYEHGPNRGDRVWGQYVVAFLSDTDGIHKPTDVLFVPDSELISAALRSFEGADKLFTLSGDKWLPGDAKCCPTGVSTIVFSVVDGKVVTLHGEWHRREDSD